MSFMVLDCTLRDGGYYTDWDFNFGLVKKYLNTLGQLPVDFCEVGYCSPAKEGYLGEYFYLPYSTLKALHSVINSNIQLVIMLNAKDCQPEMIPLLLKNCHEFIGLIRIAVHPNQLKHGLSIAAAVKENGFSVGVNIMHLHNLIDNQKELFKDLLKQKDNIDYLSFVDSFGSCFPEQVGKIVKDAKLSLPFKIGFHGHDNLGLAFANSLAAIESGVDVVDSTMLGLGRGAGNLRTELITTYLSKMKSRQNNFLQLADSLEEWQMLAKEKSFKDGLDLPYIVSGLEQLPQSKVMEMMGKKRYATSMIIRSVCQSEVVSEEAEQHFPLLEQSNDYLGKEADVCVILGGGNSAREHCAAIRTFVKKNGAVIIHSSFKHAVQFDDANISQFVCLSGDEASKLDVNVINQLSDKLKFIVTVPPRLGLIPQTFASQKISIFSVEPLAFTEDPLKKDSPLSLAIGLSQVLNNKEIMLAGFDGYSGLKQDLAKEVQEILDASRQLYPDVKIQSLTNSRYEIPQSSVYALID